MSIYDNPGNYSKYTNMPLEDAIARCEHFKQQREKLRELSKCPMCNKYSLFHEAGEYESGISSYIYCDSEDEDCEFTADGDFRGFESEIHSDFDVVLMFAGVLESEGLEAVEKQLGISWSEFISKEAASF